MIIRIVTATDSGRAIGDHIDRGRLARAAARVPGLETLIIGWRDDAEPADARPPVVVVSAWLDVASMLAATRVGDAAFLRDRLALDIAVEGGELYELMSRTFGSLPTPSSILRVITIRARQAGDATLFERLRDIQERLTQVGLIGSHIGRRVGPDGIDALVVGVWRDQEAVVAATGGRTDRSAFSDSIERWLESQRVDSYRAIEIAPRLPMASGPPILILDGDGRVVDLTPAAAAALGRTQEEAVGLRVQELAIGNEPSAHDTATAAAATPWTEPFPSVGPADASGRSTWPLRFGGHVLIRWRLRRDVPVAGRHTLLVRRENEGEITADDIAAAVAEAFPFD